MTDDSGRESQEIVELDVTPPELDQSEWDRATSIIKEHLSPDYDLAIQPGQQRRAVVRVREENMSPSWEELRAHCARIAETIQQYEKPELPSFADDEAAELRLYPIRRKDRPTDEEPNSVVISLESGKVVSFNQSEPESEESSA
ncbi:MAG: hypothetical protein H0V37_03955 [Chloroflexia bacterium]|nr:hypothetical protein [Chloroflexia bacterium]